MCVCVRASRLDFRLVPSPGCSAVALRLPAPPNKGPRVRERVASGASHAGAADAFCCRLFTQRGGSATLNNLEFIMCGEEERWSPSRRQGRCAGGTDNHL